MKTLALTAVIGCAVVFGCAAPASAQDAPHAVHGPRYGGMFATASLDTLHLEAVWTEQRRLRVFVVDASGNPLPLDQQRDLEATALAGDREAPLRLLEAEGYFEARIPTLTMPAVMIVRLKPPAATTVESVTFSFSSYSQDVLGIGSSSPAEIPGTLAGILSALADDRLAVKAFIDKEEFFALLGPEDRIRERVLAIEAYLPPLPTAERENARSAIASVVRACWLLHTVLDYGTADQRDAALKQLGDALDRIPSAVSRLVK